MTLKPTFPHLLASLLFAGLSLTSCLVLSAQNNHCINNTPVMLGSDTKNPSPLFEKSKYYPHFFSAKINP